MKPQIPFTGVGRGRDGLPGGPSNLDRQEQRFPVDLRRHVGEQSSHASHGSHRAKQDCEGNAERLGEAGVRSAGDRSADDDPQQQSDKKAEQAEGNDEVA